MKAEFLSTKPDNLPELGPDLVSTLSGLNMNDFSHFED